MTSLQTSYKSFDQFLSAAVAEEKKRQREGLKKQRDQYITRSEKMKRELKELKQQKSDLIAGHGKRSPSPKTNEFIKENEKLQVRIFFQHRPPTSSFETLCVCVFVFRLQLHTNQTTSLYNSGSQNDSGFNANLDIKKQCFSFFFRGFLRKFVRKL